MLHRQAQTAALTGLLRQDDLAEIVGAVAPNDVPGWFTPDVAILDLAVTALELAASASPVPLEYEGLREKYLPEREFRGRVEHRNSQYALYATACIRGGLQPDLANDAGWWHTRLWNYALYGLVIYSRAASERGESSVADIAQTIADRHQLSLSA